MDGPRRNQDSKALEHASRIREGQWKPARQLRAAVGIKKTGGRAGQGKGGGGVQICGIGVPSFESVKWGIKPGLLWQRLAWGGEGGGVERLKSGVCWGGGAGRGGGGRVKWFQRVFRGVKRSLSRI